MARASAWPSRTASTMARWTGLGSLPLVRATTLPHAQTDDLAQVEGGLVLADGGAHALEAVGKDVAGSRRHEREQVVGGFCHHGGTLAHPPPCGQGMIVPGPYEKGRPCRGGLVGPWSCGVV